MRALHVITTLTGGGAERLVAQLVPQIANTGAKCAVMSVYPSAVPPEIVSGNVDVIQISRNGRFDAGFFSRMVSGMKSWRPDVVHTHLHNGNYWGRAAAMAAGMPMIVRTEHSPCDPTTRVPGSGIADRWLNASTGAIITFLQEQGRFLARFEGFNEKKLAIIPNGIVHRPIPDAEAVVEARKRLGAEPGTFAIVQLGNLHKVKNQRLAIAMLAQLDPALRERTRLFFVGEGADRPALTAQACELGLTQYVTFLGFRHDVSRLLPGADLAIMTSLREGMPLALLEAMSAGVPVLSTPWPGAQDLLLHGEAGTVASDWEPRTFARSVEAIADDLEHCRSVAQSALLIARRDYDIGVIAQRHRELYERLSALRAA